MPYMIGTIFGFSLSIWLMALGDTALSILQGESSPLWLTLPGSFIALICGVTWLYFRELDS